MKRKTKTTNPAKKPNELILISGMTLLVVVSVIVGAMFYGKIYTRHNSNFIHIFTIQISCMINHIKKSLINQAYLEKKSFYLVKKIV